jgi:putative transposase
MIESQHPQISIRRQCDLIALNRATYYTQPAGESPFNLRLMRLIDEQYLRTPFYGYPKMTAALRRQGYGVNRKRVARLMQKMGLQAVFPRRNLSKPAPGHRIYPYLLRGLAITQPNQVWSADITYVPMLQGFMYLVAIIDWYSRFVLAWQLSNTLDGAFCLDALNAALAYGQPHIFNTDQGAQFTAQAFTDRLEAVHIGISMDGRGRALDNIFIERLWRTVKYEDIYLNLYETVPDLHGGLGHYFDFYNYERPHQSLDYRVPSEVYHPCEGFASILRA